jgi:hypothetical protein
MYYYFSLCRIDLHCKLRRMRFITLKLEKMTLTLNSIAFAAESGYWLKVVVSEEVARLREQHVLHEMLGMPFEILSFFFRLRRRNKFLLI